MASSSQHHKNDQGDWGDVAVVTAARLWSFRREALLAGVLVIWVMFLSGGPQTQAIPALIVTALALWFWRQPLWRWLHASRIRRQWARAVITAGAADPPPKRSRKAQALLGPKVLNVQVTSIGDLLTVKVGRGRGTVESLSTHRAQLAADLDGWRHRVREVRVEPTEGASRARVMIVRRDPFQDRQPIPWPDRSAAALSLWDSIALGVDENGRDIRVSLVEKNLLIGGEPGAGKSATLSLIAASAALDSDCRLYLLDGKQVELAPWRSSAEILIGPSITEANVLLEHLRSAMEARYQDLLAAGLRKVERDPSMPLHVLIIDELALYLQDADRKARGQFAEQLRDLIARGRAAGVIVIAATQKPAADTIPTFIRDLMNVRLALRCTTSQASDTVLGQGAASAGADASTIPIDQRGVGYLLSEGLKPQRLKGYYLTDADIADIASRAIWAREGDSELQEMLAAATTEAAPAGARDGLGAADEIARPHPTTPSPPTPAERSDAEAVTRCLPSEGEGITQDEWAARAGLSWYRLKGTALPLVERGVVIQTGTGRRGSKRRYRLADAGGGHDSSAIGFNSDGGTTP